MAGTVENPTSEVAPFSGAELYEKNRTELLNAIETIERRNNQNWNSSSNNEPGPTLVEAQLKIASDILRKCDEEKERIQKSGKKGHEKKLDSLSRVLKSTAGLLDGIQPLKDFEALKKEMPQHKRSMRRLLYLLAAVTALILLGVALLAATVITHGAALPLFIGYCSYAATLMSPFVVPLIAQMTQLGASISPALNQLGQLFTGPIGNFCADCAKSAAVVGHSFISSLNATFNNNQFLTSLVISSGVTATLTAMAALFKYGRCKETINEDTTELSREEMKNIRNQFQDAVTTEQVREEQEALNRTSLGKK